MFEFITVLTCALVLAGFATYQFYRINLLNIELGVNICRTVGLGEIDKDLLMQSDEINSYLVYHNNRYLEQFIEYSDKNQKTIKGLEQVSGPKEKAVVIHLLDSQQSYTNLMEKAVIPLAQKGDFMGAVVAARYQGASSLFNQMFSLAQRVQGLRRQDALNMLTEMNRQLILALWSGFGMGMLLLIVCITAYILTKRTEIRYRTLFDGSRDAIMTFNPSTFRLFSGNPAALELFGATGKAGFIGLALWDMAPERQPDGRSSAEKAKEMVEIALNEGSHFFEWTYRQLDGREFPASVLLTRMEVLGKTVMQATVRDITKHKVDEEKIQQLAHFDVLTGMPNRSLFADRVNQAIETAKRSANPLSLMFLDLDHFKDINDTLGHRIGDELLIKLAERIKLSLRLEDTIARMGGDEFILLLPDTDAGGAVLAVEKLLNNIAQPCHVEEYELTVTSSIGVAIYPNNGEDLETLYRCADIAMYEAKQGGRNSFRLFTPQMQQRSENQLLLVSALRRAVDNGELMLHYQPQVSLEDGRIVGVEALLRWLHPEMGMISPDEFIPLAEETGLILPIGEWVLKTAIHQMKSWMEADLPVMTVAVNLSAVQLRQQNLPKLITRLLADAELPAQYLELELTESVAMKDPEMAVSMMDELHKCGIRMVIDDFGTGYSSLAYLKRFRSYKLKIDQSFVRDIASDPEDEAIVDAVISLAKSLRLCTLAEGVETEQQLHYLRAKGCDEVQGYYFSRPLPPNALLEWMTARISHV